MSQTVKIVLPFTGNSRDWALYLLDLPLGEWSWKVTWGLAAWRPWTHCALFDECLFSGCGVVRATTLALLFVSLAVFSTHLV